MKIRYLVFGALIAALASLYKRLVDMEETLIITEAELHKLQRERDAMEESYKESLEDYERYNKEHPLPDDMDTKLHMAMMDAIYNAHARETLGDNYLEDDEDEDDSEDKEK